MYLATDTLIKIMYNSINLEFKKIVLSLIVTIAFCIVASSTFVHFEMDDNYFQLLPMSIGVGVVAVIAVLSCFINKEIQRFCFILPDILFIVIVVYYVARYDYELQLANWKILYAVLLLLLWFAARIILSNLAISKSILLGGFVGIGCVLAVWGMLQLYGVQRSNHNIFPITGPFYNPGPYSGYIAMLFPIVFNQLLSINGKKRYVWLTAFSIMIIILPAGMSRSAWLALLMSCLWLLFIHNNWIYKIKQYAHSHFQKAILLSMLVISILTAFSFFLFQMKADSANGRLFIWKNTCKAIHSQPFWGYGPGSFSMVYGREQIAYFASGNYSSKEAYVAGSPEYAFNECLQACIEGGVILLLLITSFFIICMRKGFLNNEFGSCAALLSLVIFSFSSYPFQLLPFGIIGVLLLAICVSNSYEICIDTRNICINLLSVFVFSGSVFFSCYLWHVKSVSKKWNQFNMLRIHKDYDEALVGYSELYGEMKYNVDFLFDYAQILIAQKKYDDACVVLERAKMVSCNVSLWNVQGKTYQLNAKYIDAERCFKKSADLLPIRLYPYYLLAKLYVEPNFYDANKARQMAEIVLKNKPKVHSQAVNEMREEMEALSSNISHNY